MQKQEVSLSLLEPWDLAVEHLSTLDSVSGLPCGQGLAQPLAFFPNPCFYHSPGGHTLGLSLAPSF